MSAVHTLEERARDLENNIRNHERAAAEHLRCYENAVLLKVCDGRALTEVREAIAKLGKK